MFLYQFPCCCGCSIIIFFGVVHVQKKKKKNYKYINVDLVLLLQRIRECIINECSSTFMCVLYAVCLDNNELTCIWQKVNKLTFFTLQSHLNTLLIYFHLMINWIHICAVKTWCQIGTPLHISISLWKHVRYTQRKRRELVHHVSI